MYLVGQSDKLINIISKGVLALIKRIHLESTATLSSNTVVVPPRELWYHDGVVATS